MASQPTYKQDLFVGSKFIKVYEAPQTIILTDEDRRVLNPAGIIQMFSVPSNKYFYLNPKGNLPYIGSDTGEQMFKDIKAWKKGGVGILYNPPNYSTQLEQGVNSLRTKLYTKGSRISIDTLSDMVAVEYNNRYGSKDFSVVKEYVRKNHVLFLPTKHSIREAADILRALYLVINEAKEYDIQAYLDDVGCVTLTGRKLKLMTIGFQEDLFFALTRFHLPPPKNNTNVDVYFYTRGYYAMSNSGYTKKMSMTVLKANDERLLSHLKEYDEIYSNLQVPVNEEYYKKYEAFTISFLSSNPMFYITYKRIPGLPKLTEDAIKNRDKTNYPTVADFLNLYEDDEIFALLGIRKYVYTTIRGTDKPRAVQTSNFTISSRSALILKVSKELMNKGVV